MLVGLAMWSSGGQGVIACNPKAIGESERPRYRQLAGKIATAAGKREELSDGYRYRLAEERVSLVEVAEWMRMERRCCPFPRFTLEVRDGVTLTLRGPEGVKAILAAAFRE